MTVILDPFQAAAQATEIQYSNDVYGQIEIDAWFVVLQKGAGKVPYDEGVHPAGQRRTAIRVNITDIGGNNYTREFIGEIGTDGWLKKTKPSLDALGVTDLRAFSGAWVHAVMEPFGEYTDSSGNKKQRTAPVVKQIFRTQADCEAAAQGNTDDAQMDWTAPAANGNGAAPANDGEKAIALAFLPAIVKGCVRGNGVDAAALDAAIKGNPILAKHFTMASPEVAQAMAAALAEPAF